MILLGKKMKKWTICLVGPEHPFVFTELGKLLHCALSALGYDVLITSNQIRQHTRNIVIGAHLMSAESDAGLPENTIILNTEQLRSLRTYHDGRQAYADRVIELARKFIIWDYGYENILYFKELGLNHVHYLQLGWQPELAVISPQQRDIDVLFYGSINERRSHILTELAQRGLKTQTLFDVWGQERDEWIARSRIVLNMHYYDSEIFEIIRCFYLMSNGIAVVSEENPHALIHPMYRNGVVAARYEQLVDACVILCNNDALLNQQRQLAIDTIRQYPQTLILQRLLAQC